MTGPPGDLDDVFNKAGAKCPIHGWRPLVVAPGGGLHCEACYTGEDDTAECCDNPAISQAFTDRPVCLSCGHRFDDGESGHPGAPSNEWLDESADTGPFIVTEGPNGYGRRFEVEVREVTEEE